MAGPDALILAGATRSSMPTPPRTLAGILHRRRAYDRDRRAAAMVVTGVGSRSLAKTWTKFWLLRGNRPMSLGRDREAM